VFIITDGCVNELYVVDVIHQLRANNVIVHPYVIPSGEQSKTLEWAQLCWEEMLFQGADRSSVIIGFGGGVVTDFAGLVASCYMRGVDLLLVPTTLLGMVDAAIGGKTGVNLATGKNIVGTFYPAKCVFFNTFFLNSLSEREYRAGLAEVIKYGVACDAAFFEWLEQYSHEINRRDLKIIDLIVEKACKIKVDIVERDEREDNIRAILNWGHTFAHAIETATEYRIFLHGEAVAIGMHCAALVSLELGLITPEIVARQAALCQTFGLNTELPNISIDILIDLMRKDKKSVSGAISLIVAQGIGKVQKIEAVDPNIIRRALGHVGISC